MKHFRYPTMLVYGKEDRKLVFISFQIGQINLCLNKKLLLALFFVNFNFHRNK